MKNKKSESYIRDYLASNISLIEEGLSLIKKEYYLKDNDGSSGYVDILARDIFGNFVIIEIKKDKFPSRQTMNEVLKYHALIKQNYKAKNSEIRIIILSTHWQELIRPFSNMVNNTTFAIKGFKLVLDPTTFQIIAVEEVEPLPHELTRDFFPYQFLFLYTDPLKREEAIRNIIQQMKKIDLEDYILVKLEATSLNNSGIVYPYPVLLILQDIPFESLVARIETLSGISIEVDEDDPYDLYDEFVIAFKKNIYYDDFEICYPEKLDATLANGNWQPQEIYKNGIFSSDPRLTYEMLIQEAQGISGNSKEKFFGIAETTQPERLKEIIENTEYCLENVPEWYNVIVRRLNNLLVSREKARVGLYIFNPTLVMKGIIYTILHNDHTATKYLPMYTLIIDYLDKPCTEFFKGNLLWNQSNPNYSLLKGANSSMVPYEIALGLFDDTKLMQAGLYYGNYQKIIENNKTIFNSYIEYNEENDEIEISFRPHAPFTTFWRRDSQFLKDIMLLSNAFHTI